MGLSIIMMNDKPKKTRKTNPKSRQTTVSVVIPAYNAEGTIEDCLNSLLAQTCPPQEIIVVDDGSDDSTRECVSRFSTVKLLPLVGRYGAGGARNAGAEVARGEILAFLDSDCTAPIDWIERIEAVFEKHPELGAAGGGYRHSSVGDGILETLSEIEESKAAAYSERHPDTVTLPGGNMAVHRRIWERGRSGREEIHFRGMASGEDTVICADLRRIAGVRYFSELTVKHMPRGGRGYLKRHVYRGFSGMTLVLKGLISRSGSNLVLYGGNRLAFGTGLLWIAAAAFLLAAMLPDLSIFLASLGGLSLLGNLLLVAPFSQKIPTRSEDSKTGMALVICRGIAMHVILSLRTACWGLGAAIALERHFSQRIEAWSTVILSIAHFWIPGRVSKLFYFVTARCNARCSFCFNLENVKNGNQRVKAELSLDEIQKIAGQFGQLPYVTFSGGEPFLRRDLADIVSAFYRRSKTRWVTIPTNASLPDLIFKTVRRILVTCPSIFLTVQISLDEMGEAHDKSRKIPGLFSKLETTLELLSGLRACYHNLRIQIATCYTGENLEKLEEIAAYCRKRYAFDQQGFYLIRDDDQLITDATVGIVPQYLAFLSENERTEWKSRRKSLWNRAIRALWGVTYADLAAIKLEHQFIRPCHAGSKFVTLFDDGQISPCELLASANYGNVREEGYNVNEMLKRDRVRHHRREEILRKKCSCEWMCAPPINMLYDTRSYWRLFKSFVHPERSINKVTGRTHSD